MLRRRAERRRSERAWQAGFNDGLSGLTRVGVGRSERLPYDRGRVCGAMAARRIIDLARSEDL